MLSSAQIEHGGRQLLNKLDDLAVDVPLAPCQVGDVLGRLVASKAADLKVLGQHILEADMEEVPEGEDTMLISEGRALKVIGSLLRSVAVGGEEALKELWTSSGLQLVAFMPRNDREDASKLQAFAAEFGITKLIG